MRKKSGTENFLPSLGLSAGPTSPESWSRGDGNLNRIPIAPHRSLRTGLVPIRSGHTGSGGPAWRPLRSHLFTIPARISPASMTKPSIGTTSPSVPLDVNGAVRAGSSTTVTSCGLGQANGEGSQRYNYTTHRMEYCNGTTWLPVGSSAPSCVTRQGGGYVSEQASVSCLTGETMTGGGCASGGTWYLYQSYPSNSNTWFCNSGSTGTYVNAWAICCTY